MLLTVMLQGALLQALPPPCVAVHGGRLNVKGDSSAIAIAAALQRHGYVDQANCVVAMIDVGQGGLIAVRLTLLSTRYRPALETLGGGRPAEAFDMAARRLAEQVRFWQPCWTSRVPADGWRRVFTDAQYAALCDLIAEWLRPDEH